MAAVRLRRSLRGPRPEDQRTALDGYVRRSDLRFALATSCACGSVCLRGFAGEVRAGLRSGMDESHERGSLRFVAQTKCIALAGVRDRSDRCATTDACASIGRSWEARALRRKGRSEPSRQRLREPRLSQVTDPRHISVGANQHGGGSSNHPKYRKIPRANIIGVDQLNPIRPRSEVETATFAEI